MVQKDEEAQAAEAGLPCAPASFALALLVQRCADKHSAVSARALGALSKCLTAILARDSGGAAAVAWLQGLTHALCHAACLVLDDAKLTAAVDAGPAADEAPRKSSATERCAQTQSALQIGQARRVAHRHLDNHVLGHAL